MIKIIDSVHCNYIVSEPPPLGWFIPHIQKPVIYSREAWGSSVTYGYSSSLKMYTASGVTHTYHLILHSAINFYRHEKTAQNTCTVSEDHKSYCIRMFFCCKIWAVILLSTILSICVCVSFLLFWFCSYFVVLLNRLPTITFLIGFRCVVSRRWPTMVYLFHLYYICI